MVCPLFIIILLLFIYLFFNINCYLLGMIRSSVESTPDTSGQFTPSVRQFSAPKAVRETE